MDLRASASTSLLGPALPPPPALPREEGPPLWDLSCSRRALRICLTGRGVSRLMRWWEKGIKGYLFELGVFHFGSGLIWIRVGYEAVGM